MITDNLFKYVNSLNKFKVIFQLVIKYGDTLCKSLNSIYLIYQIVIFVVFKLIVPMLGHQALWTYCL